MNTRQDHSTTGPWRVFITWTRPVYLLTGATSMETSHQHQSWPDARQDALEHACMNGVRYVSVQDPDDVVCGEYDRDTNRWRQYPKTLADVEHTTKITTEDRRAVEAWCTCGWSRFTMIGSGQDAADTARDEALDLARKHQADPCS